METSWLDKILNTGLGIVDARFRPQAAAQGAAQAAPTAGTDWKKIGIFAAVAVGAVVLLLSLRD